jgi:hypothetical protein
VKKELLSLMLFLLGVIGSYFALVNLGTDKNEDGTTKRYISIFKNGKRQYIGHDDIHPDYEYTFYKYKDEEEKVKWKVAGMEEIRLDNIKWIILLMTSHL